MYAYSNSVRKNPCVFGLLHEILCCIRENNSSSRMDISANVFIVHSWRSRSITAKSMQNIRTYLHSRHSFTMPVAVRRSMSPDGPLPSTKRMKGNEPPYAVDIPLSEPVASASIHEPLVTSSISEERLVEEEMAKPVEIVKKYGHELDYRNKLVLAPMVRTGSREWKFCFIALLIDNTV